MGNRSFAFNHGDRNAFISHDKIAHLPLTQSPMVQSKILQRDRTESLKSGHGTSSPPSLISSSDSSNGTYVSSNFKLKQSVCVRIHPSPTITQETERNDSSQKRFFDCAKNPNRLMQFNQRNVSFLSPLFRSCRRFFRDEIQHESADMQPKDSIYVSDLSYGSLSEPHAIYTEEEFGILAGELRNYHIVATAALPWFTGHAIYPTLRAAYLIRRNRCLLKSNNSHNHQRVDIQPKLEIDASILFNDDENFSTPLTMSSTCSSLEYSYFSTHDTSPDSGNYAMCPLETFTSFTDHAADTPIRTIGAHRHYENQEEPSGKVTLVVPWLRDRNDRIKLFGSISFENCKEQEEFIRQWLANEADMQLDAEELDILFYPARYHTRTNSIFALGDILPMIPPEHADVCILEEPEHLNWYRFPGSTSWNEKFRHVVGVAHAGCRVTV